MKFETGDQIVIWGLSNNPPYGVGEVHGADEEVFNYGVTMFSQEGYGTITNTRAYNLKSHNDRVELTVALNSYRDSQREMHVSARKRDRESLVKQMVEIAAKVGEIDEGAVLEREKKTQDAHDSMIAVIMGACETWPK